MEGQFVIGNALNGGAKADQKTRFTTIARLRIEDEERMIVAREFLANFVNSAHNRIVEAAMQPDTEILVKISKEDAGAISLTRVLQQRITVRDLVGLLAGTTGKDCPRIQAIVERGSFVKGMSRLRWEGFVAPETVQTCVQALPDPWPERPFVLEEVSSVDLAGMRESLPIDLEAARTRRLFKRHRFLDVLRDVCLRESIRYERYDYEARADVFVAELGPDGADALRQAAALLPGSVLKRAVERFAVQRVILRAKRD